MQTDLRECYRILEVEPGANLEEVKCAYRELVKVWHPDRFTHDPNLQRKAQEKLKQINHAYERVCAVELNASVAGGFSNSGTAAQEEVRPQPPRPTSAPAKGANRTRRVGQIAVAVVIIAIGRAVFSSMQSPQTRSPVAQSSYPVSQHAYQPTQSPPRLDAQPVEAPTAETKPSLAAGAASDVRPEATSVAGKDYFTIGSTKEEVLTVQGMPFSREPSDRFFTYPYGSQVFFKDDRVTMWRSSNDNPLKAKLLSASTVENKGFFTVGSTKGEVLAVQGMPFSFSDTQFTYPYGSQVFFEGARVTKWTASNSNPLKARLLPNATVQNRGFFTVGSTRDEVLVVQGTPLSFNDTHFTYPTGAQVFFTDGRVTSWRMTPTFPLKVELGK